MTNNNAIVRNSFKAWVLAARPKTLIGCTVPVMIGTAFALQNTGYNIRIVPTLLCFLFAFLMQMDANFINDYFDFKRGNDDETRLGPLRACSQGWISLHAMRRAILWITALSCLVGLPLVWYGGLEMVVIGLLCVVFCFLYTTHLSYHGMGDLLVVLFFGIIPVNATYHLAVPTEAQPVVWTVVMASVACGLVIDTLLVVNNYRDIDNDKRAGKHTLVVKMGTKMTEIFYLLLGLAAVFMGFLFLFSGLWWAALLPVAYLPLHYYTYKRMMRIGKGKALNLILGETARNILVYGVLVAIGILIG